MAGEFLQASWITENKYIALLKDKIEKDRSFSFDVDSLRYFCFVNKDLELLIKLMQRYPALLIKQRRSETVSDIPLLNRPAFYMLDDCCVAGSREIVEYLDRNGFVASSDAMNNAARYSHIDVLEYLHTHRKEGCSRDAMDLACAQGSLEALEFLNDKRKEGATRKAMDMAATNGHYSIVEYLHNRRTEGCTAQALDGAAGNGHIDLVKFLQTKRKEGATKKAIDRAATNGHLGIIVYLFENRSDGCTAQALDGAASHGHLDIVKYLTDLNAPCTTEAMDLAASHGHLDVVVYLHTHRGEGCTNQAINLAAGNGHMSIVRYLAANRTEGCTHQAIDIAAKNGHIEPIRFLLNNYAGLVFSQDALYYAITFDRFHILRLLNRRLGWQPDTRYQSKYGYLTIQEILDHYFLHNPPLPDDSDDSDDQQDEVDPYDDPFNHLAIALPTTMVLLGGVHIQ
eukprot:gene3790-4371_t